MNKISIIGAGTMGHSIALTAAWRNLDTSIYAMDEREIKRATESIRMKVDTLVQSGLLPEDESNQLLRTIRFTTSLVDCIKGTDFIIEAVPENPQLKKELYQLLEEVIPPEVPVASNTSGIPTTFLFSEMLYPERFIITHFWNPAHLIPLVEVVPGEATSEKTIEQTMAMLERLGKKAILVKKEVPGFIGNRLQFALFREAEYLLNEGVASKEDIDLAVTHSIGRRLPITGPLMSADFTGLDVAHAISEYLYEDLSSGTKPGAATARLVENHQLGAKSGQGFYPWDEEETNKISKQREQLLIEFLKLDAQKGSGKHEG
ncbi:MAG: 3-hydroxyacyl-CoA dehydrogenase family protein [Lysinibacillus sp.]